MIEIQQIKLPIDKAEESAIKIKCAKKLHIPPTEIKKLQIIKKSVDARHKPDLFFIFSCVICVDNEDHLLKKAKKDTTIKKYEPEVYQPFYNGKNSISKEPSPVIIGAGPAGLFAAYLLAKNNAHPIVIERGKMIEERTVDVDAFWKTGTLQLNSNVQFGEGGAGTFSDGKLNTLVKDKNGRNRFVLETFVKFGADSSILYENKPHVGTDILLTVISNLRKEIVRLGGKFLFQTQVTDIKIEQNRVYGVVLNDKTILKTDQLILAIGHSARDTFQMLFEKSIPMLAKEFAVGFRIEHPQCTINRNQYQIESDVLPPASYKLAAKTSYGRGVYSFCMCPGGYVVNASSEENRLAVNGMSYFKRDSKNANSAIVISVGQKEYSLKDPMGAISYQRKLEERAFQLGKGAIPQQLYGDFLENRQSTAYGSFSSETKGKAAFCNLRELFSEEINLAFMEGMTQFSKRILDFEMPDAILSGVESRTSSPVRIIRNEFFMSDVTGLFPCGEGAGYAGGIMSAAMDGLKVAEAVLKGI